ncbi:MAG: hypothetical protein ACM3JP_01215 [Betaproteobacteria bacterium]
MREITIGVAGYPPAKNEAKSMLAGGHVHAYQVLALLQAASSEAKSGATVYFPDESLGLEVVLTSPAPPPSDATNYLGGVADVLEDKKHRGDLPHLGELAHFALYRNDRQFHEVRYRWEQGSTVRYQVRIWER